MAAARPGRAPAAPPRTRDRFALWLVAAVLGVLLLAGGVLWLLTRNSTEGERVRLPESFAGYQLLHNSRADELKQQMADAAAIPAIGRAIIGHASVGAYGRNTGDQPALAVVALPRRSIAALGSGDHEQTVHQLLDNTIPDSRPFPSGPHGGVLRCGEASRDGSTVSACAWSDERTAGLAVVGYPSLSPAQAAALVNRLRDLVE